MQCPLVMARDTINTSMIHACSFLFAHLSGAHPRHVDLHRNHAEAGDDVGSGVKPQGGNGCGLGERQGTVKIAAKDVDELQNDVDVHQVWPHDLWCQDVKTVGEVHRDDVYTKYMCAKNQHGNDQQSMRTSARQTTSSMACMPGSNDD